MRVTAAVSFAVATIAMLQTSSIPLLPALPEALGTDIASTSWVVTSTLVVGAAVNPVVGRVGDLYGKRTVFLACLGVAIAGSVVAATAGSLLGVVAGRALQGVGSGIVPLAYGMIRDELPAHHVARGVAAVTAAGAGVGAGLGPVVMGAVLSAHGWRAVFWLTAALCLAALVAAGGSTRGAATRFPGRFDVPGAVVLCASLAVLLLGITNGSRWGWTSAPVLALVAAALGLGAWWTRWELGRDEPLVDLRVSRAAPVLLAHVGGLMVGFATFTQFIAAFTLVSLPEATGHGLGRSLAVAGFAQLPGAVAMLAAVVVASHVAATRDPMRVLRAGALVVSAGFVLSALRHGSLADVVIGVVVVDVGLGTAFCALPLLLNRHVGHGLTAAVNAVNALARVVGSVLASAVVTSVMATGAVVAGGHERPAEWTFLVAYALGAGIAASVPCLIFIMRLRLQDRWQGGTP